METGRFFILRETGKNYEGLQNCTFFVTLFSKRRSMLTGKRPGPVPKKIPRGLDKLY